MADKYYISKSLIHGDGMFARVPIRAGEIIFYAYKNLDYAKPSEFLFHVNEAIGKVNHSDKPNAVSEISENDVVVKAKRDIMPKQEIVIDYAQWNKMNPKYFHTAEISSWKPIAISAVLLVGLIFLIDRFPLPNPK